MYVNPMASVVTSGGRLTRDQEKQIQDQFEDFYIDVFEEVGKFGDVEDVLVCDNLSDHLIGEFSAIRYLSRAAVTTHFC